MDEFTINEAGPALYKPKHRSEESAISADGNDVKDSEDEKPMQRQLDMVKLCSAYSNLSFAALAAKFPPEYTAEPTEPKMDTMMDLESELEVLIRKGMLDARIDAVTGSLISQTPSEWTTICNGAKEAAGDVERSLSLGLHEVIIVSAGLEIRKQRGSR